MMPPARRGACKGTSRGVLVLEGPGVEYLKDQLVKYYSRQLNQLSGEKNCYSIIVPQNEKL